MTREEAIEMLKKDKEQRGNCFISDALDMAIKALKQEPRKGHWIPRNSFLLQYKCSECGWESEKYNYCPNCGADMREVEK